MAALQFAQNAKIAAKSRRQFIFACLALPCLALGGASLAPVLQAENDRRDFNALATGHRYGKLTQMRWNVDAIGIETYRILRKQLAGHLLDTDDNRGRENPVMFIDLLKG